MAYRWQVRKEKWQQVRKCRVQAPGVVAGEQAGSIRGSRQVNSRRCGKQEKARQEGTAGGWQQEAQEAARESQPQQACWQVARAPGGWQRWAGRHAIPAVAEPLAGRTQAVQARGGRRNAAAARQANGSNPSAAAGSAHPSDPAGVPSRQVVRGVQVWWQALKRQAAASGREKVKREVAGTQHCMRQPMQS